MRMKPGIWFVHLVMFYRSLQSSLLIVLSGLINAKHLEKWNNCEGSFTLTE